MNVIERMESIDAERKIADFRVKGIAMLVGKDRRYAYEYASKLLGRPIYTHEFLIFEQILKEKAKPDFIEICKNLEEN